MPTTNVYAGFSWVKVAENTEDKLLITWDDPATIEVATTTANSAPTVKGHKLSRENAITRAVLGSGYVWVRAVKGSVVESVCLIVDK